MCNANRGSAEQLSSEGCVHHVAKQQRLLIRRDGAMEEIGGRVHGTVWVTQTCALSPAVRVRAEETKPCDGGGRPAV